MFVTFALNSTRTASLNLVLSQMTWSCEQQGVVPTLPRGPDPAAAAAETLPLCLISSGPGLGERPHQPVGPRKSDIASFTSSPLPRKE